MKRRGFLGSILAAGFAPAAVASGVLMPLGRVWAPAGPDIWREFGERVTAAEVLARQRMLEDAIERMVNPPIVMLQAEFLRQLTRMGYASPSPGRVIRFDGIDHTPGGYGSGQFHPLAHTTRA